MPLPPSRWRTLPRSFYRRHPTEVAPELLNKLLVRDDGRAGRIVEVEAYAGDQDPAAHSFRGMTPRTATMFGECGHLYVYFTYGMHYCANIVCGPDGVASALLLRAGEVVEGLELARARRPASRSDTDLASGPARLATVLGLTTADSGNDALAGPYGLLLPATPVPPELLASGPRVGVAGDGGTHQYPWRFWLAGDPTVSKYKPAVRKVRKPARGSPGPGPEEGNP